MSSHARNEYKYSYNKSGITEKSARRDLIVMPWSQKGRQSCASTAMILASLQLGSGVANQSAGLAAANSLAPASRGDMKGCVTVPAVSMV